MELNASTEWPEIDSNLDRVSISLATLGHLAVAPVLTDKERAYVSALVVDAPLFSALEQSSQNRVRWQALLFHLLSALIVLILLIQLPLKRPSTMTNKVLSLHISVFNSPPKVVEPLQSASATGAPIPSTASESNSGATVDALSRPLARELSQRPSVLASKAEVLEAWSSARANSGSDELGDYPSQSPVFDGAMRARLSRIAPGRLSRMAESSSLADVNGVQEVVIGDSCFHVTKLDDQAMRGMGVWTRGSCSLPHEDKIKIGVLR